MKRSRALLLVLLVALLALASLPTANASSCSINDCSGCCANQENLCTAGCRGNPTCLNRCFSNYLLCINNC